MSVLLILLTVFLTVIYTEYRKEKRNFEAIMGWYGIELAIIRTEIDTLKDNCKIVVESLKDESKEKTLPLVIFPKYSLESHKVCLSTGCGKYIPYETVISMSKISIQLDNLLFLQAHYEATYPLFFNKEMVGKNYYQGMIRTLEGLITQIDVFHKECDTFTIPTFPSFFSLILMK